MTRYKKTAARLKDPSRFHSYKAEDKFEEFIEPKKILEENDFQFPQQPSGTINTIYAAVAKKRWLDFCTHPRDLVLPITKEFYSNKLRQDQCIIVVRNVQVPFDPRVINAFYNLPYDIDCEYSEMVENMTAKKWSDVLKILMVEGSSWLNEESRGVNRIDLKPVAKVWENFLKSRLIPTTYTTTVSHENLTYYMPFSRVYQLM